MTMSSPQSPASVDDCADDDESWWIYFRAEGPDGKPASAREELAVSQPRKERPVGEANSQRCPAWEREKSSRVAGVAAGRPRAAPGERAARRLVKSLADARAALVDALQRRAPPRRGAPREASKRLACA